MSRLKFGGLIDRGRPLGFTFDGKAYCGFEGDTLASALIANDVKVVGRSFKYHRPRGILTAGGEEPNALVTLRSGAFAEPNTRATTISLFDGLEARSQNCWPNRAFDLLAVNQLLAPLFVAGFYYKTFMWPAKFWEIIYEPLIRRAAGLGVASRLPDPDRYDRNHAFCDLLIIGAGPAGLIAARRAGRTGLRVILADEDVQPGGRLLAERYDIDGTSGPQWAQTVVGELRSMPNVTILNRTSVFGVYDGREYAAVQRIADHLRYAGSGQPRQRLWKIIAKRSLLATGAIERPLVFGGNDRPGVMMASAVSAYINRFGAVPGNQAVIFTTTDSGWQTAIDLVKVGCEVSAVVDSRPNLPAAADEIRSSGVRVFGDASVEDACGRTLKAVKVRTRDGRTHKIGCDLLAVSGGWNPAIGLGCNLGNRPVWSEEIHSFVLDVVPDGMIPIGAAAGHFALPDVFKSGEDAASNIATDFGRVFVPGQRPRLSNEPAGVAPLPSVGSHKKKAFVDFQHDVTDTDVAIAVREGFVSVEHLKRYTTLGMGTDQGKVGQINGHALLAKATGRSIADVGTILSRPPNVPVPIGVFAGHHRGVHFRPVRYTASHDWAASMGATFVDSGQWKRAQWYSRWGDKSWLENVSCEVKATRESVGVCDVSTLGKIDVQGPDAATLLDRLYTNMFSTLVEGRARYGVMLREDGFVMDDGTTTRFKENRYFVTTTTANAAKVMQHIDYARQVLWPDLNVQATSVTEQWSAYSVAGPNSRALLQKLFSELDLSNEGLPFMAAAEFRWKGVLARIFRISFSGELAFEVSVPASLGEAFIRALFDVGRSFELTPYGTEALGVMRIEKGHVAGNEINGQTTAGDLGMERLLSKTKDYIGRAMSQRPGLLAKDRPTLVGLRPIEPFARLRAGGHLLSKNAEPIPVNDEGYVTSVAFSPSLGHWIGLALLKHGPERFGELIRIYDPLRGADVDVEVCSPVFVDPEGGRLRV